MMQLALNSSRTHMATVFISHRSADLTEAERLASDLQRHGHDVWLDEWEIAVGDSIVEHMESGLVKSANFILCYSSSGVGAPWMSREWMSAMARQLSGANVRIIPVRLTGGDPPALLADLKYADLVADWSGGVALILRSLL
jgi:hypothetical protein